MISLTEEFFGGKECGIEVKVKMLYDGKKGDIINQYVLFTKICKKQMKLYGRSQKAILEAIRICKDRNVLKEYLESEIYEATQKATKKATKEGLQKGLQKGLQEANLETAKRMLADGTLPIEKIAEFSNLPLETVKRLAESLQTVSV